MRGRLSTAALVAPAYRILAEVEVVEVLDRVEPVPLTTGVARVRAVHVGTRAPLWPPPWPGLRTDPVGFVSASDRPRQTEDVEKERYKLRTDPDSKLDAKPGPDRISRFWLTLTVAGAI